MFTNTLTGLTMATAKMAEPISTSGDTSSSMDTFLQDFLLISTPMTIVFLLMLFSLFAVVKVMEKKKINFSKRMGVATVLGLLLGLTIQVIMGFPDAPKEITAIAETTSWYTLFGYGFIDLIKMLVVPLVMVSIIHVIINMKEGANIGKLAKNTVIVTASMVAISIAIGLVIGIMFGLGKGVDVGSGTAEIKEVQSIVSTFRGLLPANPVKEMVDLNIIALVIMAIFIGSSARRLKKKYFDIVKPFYDIINACHKIISSIAMTIIKFMPYAVVALLANTIAQRGIQSIIDVSMFIVALYLSALIVFGIQLILLSIFGINPITFIKKSLPVHILAFTSRSSVGTLPMTIETLETKLGVNSGTANFVASFGTTAGMQGCAGIFPALLLVYVTNASGLPIDFTFIIMTLIVVTIGSLGIAGIPGAATMAASVSLSGMGLASKFPLISPLLAIDPIVDMGRTWLNVSGSMVNALVVDKTLGTFDEEIFKSELKDTKSSSDFIEV